MKEAAYEIIYSSELNHWWYKVRRKIVHDLIRKHCCLERGREFLILDVGCGTGALLKELDSYGAAYGIDFSEKALDFCKARSLANVRLGSITGIPYPDDAFDLVLALDILEHVEDDLKALQEIKRVLRPGGICVLFVPAFQLLWGVTDVLGQHYRRYTRPELTSKMRQEGLDIIRSSYFNTFLFFPIALVRLLVRWFRIPLKTENRTGSGVINKILYSLFYMESRLLRYVNFPFGVSVLVVWRKP